VSIEFHHTENLISAETHAESVKVKLAGIKLADLGELGFVLEQDPAVIALR